MAGQTGTESPTTNEGLGVVGAQMAAAEQANTPSEPTSPPESGSTLALEALRIANSDADPAEVVSRAKAYLDFLKENSNG